MDLELKALVEERLARDEMADEGLSEIVLSALAGADALGAVLAGDDGGDDREEADSPASPAGAYLTSIGVEGFRGIGEPASLELSPGPGLTLVVGRNGSGKSSFAEGLEVLLTGDNLRWSKRSAIWREGWRNLHHAHASLEAGLAVEGQPGATTVRRTWADDAPLEESEADVQPTGGKKTSLDALGWRDGLVSFRPFLSYNELGSMLDEGPSKLHDAVASVLGLEELSAAERALRDVRLERERDLKQVLAERNEIVELLEGVEDDRAAACRTALRGKQPDLEAVAEATRATGAAAEGSEIGALQRVLGVELPASERIASVVAKLRAAAAELTELAGTQADELLRSAELLELALGFRADFPSNTCPVCETEGVIDGEWRARAAAQAELQRGAGVRAQGARGRLEAAQRVLVFTHDDRLPEAIRRLRIDARVIELARKEESVIEMRDSLDPVERHIGDARAIASTTGLPEHVARRVVGGFCRLAVEAGCIAAVRRRRIGRGDPHAEVEATIAGATRLTSYAALALFDDKERGGDVLPRIDRDYGSRSASTFKEINKGTHEALTGHLHDLIRDAAILARGLEQAA